MGGGVGGAVQDAVRVTPSEERIEAAGPLGKQFAKREGRRVGEDVTLRPVGRGPLEEVLRADGWVWVEGGVCGCVEGGGGGGGESVVGGWVGLVGLVGEG